MLRGSKDQYWKKKVGAVVERRAKAGDVYDAGAVERIRQGMKQWQEAVYDLWAGKTPEAGRDFQTASGIPVKPLYTPADVADAEYSDEGYPGMFPYLRGIYPPMYRGRQWPTSPLLRGSSESRPIRVGMSKATLSPVWPASRSWW